MGLIKSVTGAVGGTLHDQWKEIISCEDMGNDILMRKVSTDSGVITKQSLIRVMPGQCAIIMQNGMVLDATIEGGDYTFDEATSPSFFSGDFGDVFKEMWERFKFGGDSSNKQSVFYFNMKEIVDNKFGTATPIPFQDWSHPVPNQIAGGILPLSVKVKCYGKFTFKISDPSLFMNQLTGTVEIYKKEEITEQIRTEVMSTFQNVLNELGTENYKIPVLELPSQTDEIKQMMDEKVYDETIRNRGLSIITFSVESVSLDEKSEEYINNYILGANTNIQQGTLTGAYADAVKSAAENTNGSVNGFMGVGMMNMASGNAFGGTVQNTVVKTEEQTKENIWICPKCGKDNKGKFCLKCGASKEKVKTCSKCGKIIPAEAEFCPECGEKL